MVGERLNLVDNLERKEYINKSAIRHNTRTGIRLELSIGTNTDDVGAKKGNMVIRNHQLMSGL